MSETIPTSISASVPSSAEGVIAIPEFSLTHAEFTYVEQFSSVLRTTYLNSVDSREFIQSDIEGYIQSAVPDMGKTGDACQLLIQAEALGATHDIPVATDLLAMIDRNPLMSTANSRVIATMADQLFSLRESTSSDDELVALRAKQELDQSVESMEHSESELGQDEQVLKAVMTAITAGATLCKPEFRAAEDLILRAKEILEPVT